MGKKESNRESLLSFIEKLEKLDEFDRIEQLPAYFLQFSADTILQHFSKSLSDFKESLQTLIEVLQTEENKNYPLYILPYLFLHLLLFLGPQPENLLENIPKILKALKEANKPPLFILFFLKHFIRAEKSSRNESFQKMDKSVFLQPILNEKELLWLILFFFKWKKKRKAATNFLLHYYQSKKEAVN